MVRRGMKNTRSLAAFALLALSACSGGAPPEPPEPGEPTDAGADAGTDPACVAGGGVCLPEGESAPPNRMTSPEACDDEGHVCWVLVPAGAVCEQDHDCNEDPEVSTLHGSCFSGVCICTVGYVQPGGKCAAAPPGDCGAHGGTCRQDPAECAAGELRGELQTNASCGDFVPAVCCVPSASCQGPADLVCCGAAASPYEPLCVNGWKTCGPGAPTPRSRDEGCL